MSKLLSQYQNLGRAMADQGSDVFQGLEGPVLSRWFKSPLGIELTIWRSTSDRALLQFQLSLHGEIIQWSALAGLQTGIVIETDEGETLRLDDQPQSNAVERAAIVLADMIELKGAEQIELTERLALQTRSPRTQHLDARCWLRSCRQRLRAVLGLLP